MKLYKQNFYFDWNDQEKYKTLSMKEMFENHPSFIKKIPDLVDDFQTFGSFGLDRVLSTKEKAITCLDGEEQALQILEFDTTEKELYDYIVNYKTINNPKIAYYYRWDDLSQIMKFEYSEYLLYGS